VDPGEFPDVRKTTEHTGEEPSVRELLVELWHNTEKLVRQEIALARTELEVKAKKWKGELSGGAIAAALLVCGGLALVAALILLLGTFLAAWLAALLVGVVFAGAGYAMLRKHPKISGEDVKPTRTIRSVQQDARTFKEATR